MMGFPPFSQIGSFRVEERIPGLEGAVQWLDQADMIELDEMAMNNWPQELHPYCSCCTVLKGI